MKRLLLGVLLLSTFRLTAATITATTSGSWTNAATWEGQILPTGDVPIIPSGITVTYPVDGTAYLNIPDFIKTYGTYHPRLQSNDLRSLNPVSIEVFSGELFYDTRPFVEFYIQNGSTTKVHTAGNRNAVFYSPNILNRTGQINSQSARPQPTENPDPFILSLDNKLIKQKLATVRLCFFYGNNNSFSK